jgi:hypothetical protein
MDGPGTADSNYRCPDLAPEHETTLDSDHLLRPPDKVPLAGILRKRTAEADPHGLIAGQTVGDHVCRTAGNLVPGTAPSQAITAIFAGSWNSSRHSPRRPDISRSLL